MMRRSEIWGAHAPPRAGFGASPKQSFSAKVHDGEGVLASTRGTCAPQRISTP